MKLLADLVLLAGAFFMFLSALGILRMPDVYTRLQAGTKAATLGAIAVILSVALLHPAWIGKILLVLVLVLLTSPVSSSTIARSALMAGLRPWAVADQEKSS